MIKDLKLSQRMIEAITMGQRGNDIVGNSSTMAALVSRGLITAGYRHELTNLGHEAYAAITGRTDSRRIAESEDHPAESDMITDADRLNRAADAHYANMTSADANLSFYLSQPHQESARAVTAIAEAMFPGIEHETVIAILSQSYTPGVDSLAELISGYLTRRALLTASIEAEAATDAGTELQWNDVMAGELHYASMEPESIRDYGDDDESHDLPGDAERAWDAENAALERADIESEYRAEREAEASEAAWVPVEIINADDLMYRTRKGIFLSARYFQGMRLVREDRARMNERYRAAHDVMTTWWKSHGGDFMDPMVANGKVSFRLVDKRKRIMNAIASPTLGSKIKPSSKKRNKR